MKASDLRIGNWVKIKEEFSDRDLPLETLEFQIEGFNDGSDRYEEGAKQILFWSIKNKVFGTTTSGSYDIECEPIKLTLKWLLKFGFKEFEKDCRTFFILNGLKLEMSNGGNVYYKKMYIDSIHQLQNLYFALTGEELILKEI